MKIYLPDRTEPIEVPAEDLSVADIRRNLEGLGYNVAGATATTDEDGDVHFTRPQGGAKGL